MDWLKQQWRGLLGGALLLGFWIGRTALVWLNPDTTLRRLWPTHPLESTGLLVLLLVGGALVVWQGFVSAARRR